MHTLPDLFVIYAVIGAIAPAGASASNLLILEKFSERERPNAFASFQEMSMIGSILGVLLGYFWTLASDALLNLLLSWPGSPSSARSRIWFGIREGPRYLNTLHVAGHPESLLSRIREILLPDRDSLLPDTARAPSPPVEPVPRLGPAEIHHELPLIMAASFLFNLSANLFNISYTPYLYSAGLAASSIFLVNVSNNFAQTLIFPFTGGFSMRSGSDRLVQRATYLRSIGYLRDRRVHLRRLQRTGGVRSEPRRLRAARRGDCRLHHRELAHPLPGLVGRDAGSLIGVNTALGGVAAVAEAGLSGVLSLFGSFRLVFLVSGGLFARFPTPVDRRDGRVHPPQVRSGAGRSRETRHAGGFYLPVRPRRFPRTAGRIRAVREEARSGSSIRTTFISGYRRSGRCWRRASTPCWAVDGAGTGRPASRG